MIRNLTKQLLLSCLLLSNHALADLTPEQEQSRDYGLMLYNQHMGISAIEPLRVAAKAGDVDAQYYLGETLRLNAMYMTAEAAQWYEAAANQGNLFAMLRLSSTQDLCSLFTDCVRDDTEWRERALEQGRQRAERGDTSAMIALYLADQGLSWLEKSAELGDHYAQYLLAGFYRDGDGWFLIPGKREETIEQLLKSSSEGGYPPSMLLYISYLSKREDYAGVRQWIIRSAERGYIDAIYSYAAHSAHLPESFDFEKDYIRSYALFHILSELKGGGVAPEYSRNKLNELSSLMPSNQIKQAMAFAKAWKKSNPPPSYFLPAYGF
ncbi:tetratricopeptide repeat protein [Aquipseudomonas campi]|uniref:tetratricopeptide repeat protein n=1 Tax=Aquipseudomonas campi TaxID=2731681 RepID=UPI001EFF3D2D|nr:sel1 repeat family protein [Pseudomonas campi]